ncbi:hypothetical protein [Pontibacter liquoris]|uniref:hypothetical protein n=1 Tax=Pontibacter liquoris TaxID=2905677 RepID=UPI001FA7A940|nr:hypothetical protein [Pontibacter liquoris]
MTKHFLLVLLLLVVGRTWAADTARYKVDELRLKYLKASTDENAAREFNKEMQAYNGQNALIKAYQAASVAVMAKYIWNPYGKLKQIKASSAIFEEAVKLDSRHPEIRFLRFTVEHYVPRYLDLSAHVDEDKRIVISSLQAYPKSELSQGVARTIRDFMLSKDHCTEAERKVLRNIRI